MPITFVEKTSATYNFGFPAEDNFFPRLRKPVELLCGSHDVVVIGSGYGGGVTASRMARTGTAVGLRDSGLEKWPGEYLLDPFKPLPLESSELERTMIEHGGHMLVSHIRLHNIGSAVAEHRSNPHPFGTYGNRAEEHMAANQIWGLITALRDLHHPLLTPMPQHEDPKPENIIIWSRQQGRDSSTSRTLKTYASTIRTLHHPPSSEVISGHRDRKPGNTHWREQQENDGSAAKTLETSRNRTGSFSVLGLLVLADMVSAYVFWTWNNMAMTVSTLCLCFTSHFGSGPEFKLKLRNMAEFSTCTGT
ncbi:hypothetical protein QBC47DRAFT_465455 [Echria macrotheca]|uniref:FAD/NAD(P)-binding domain-containing protein n=1 Tax=Echria macrotheca TaxID=438768 RepID=A0AAJ0B2I2_9PEZI|nr:hypothetical protein QBC47DRAFT_465455 [Echria macrotheca]